MRKLLFASLCLWATSAHAGDWWESLWRTPDQRGEQLLQQGKAAAAAQTFSDPRRKAYAELQAGNYPTAARDFAAFDDSNGNYNRGNALALAGQLQEAIKAYDAALAHDPNDREARHNRDLVARELQRKPPQPRPSSAGSASRNDQNNSGKSQTRDAGKRGNSSQNSSAQNSTGNNQGGKDQHGKSGQGANEARNNPGQKAGQGQQQSARNSPPSQSGEENARANNQKNGQANGQAQSDDDAAQARRDAAAGLGKLQLGQEPVSASPPVTEQQLALQQWLQRIPDDPGGLLRRKFMIEHMIRQQRGQP
jgi:Ca-activated chloride channel family protein